MDVIYYQTVESITNGIICIGFLGMVAWFALKAYTMYLRSQEQKHIQDRIHSESMAKVNYEGLIDGLKREIQLLKNQMEMRGKK